MTTPESPHDAGGGEVPDESIGASVDDGSTPPRCVLVTGGAGFIGGHLLAALAREGRGIRTLVSADVREVPELSRVEGVTYLRADIRTPHLAAVFSEHGVRTVVHLAAVTNAPRGMDEGEAHSVDVRGTENVLAAAHESGARNVVIVTSAAAYGYHDDTPVPVDESAALRGNDDVSIARRKRMVEEAVARFGAAHPEIGLLVLRPALVLADGWAPAVRAAVGRRWLPLASREGARRSVVWIDDLVSVLSRAVVERRTGVYNVAAPGSVTLRALAESEGTRVVQMPRWLRRGVLHALWTMGLSRDGPATIATLDYPLVLSSDRLAREFGYTAMLDAEGALARYRVSRSRTARA